jgi:L-asparaginase
MRRVTLITTGGTIEKTYDERTGQLVNRRSIVGRMLRRLRLEGTEVRTVELMSKDSLVLTDADRGRIADAVLDAIGGPGRRTQVPDEPCGVVILHGTDTLSVTAEHLLREVPDPPVPIVLTGAMRPYEMKRSDALQNLTEALFASAVLEPGIYCVAHGRALRFPGVKKDPDRGTFVKE